VKVHGVGKAQAPYLQIGVAQWGKDDVDHGR
jgi:hypothetical protein